MNRSRVLPSAFCLLLGASFALATPMFLEPVAHAAPAKKKKAAKAKKKKKATAKSDAPATHVAREPVDRPTPIELHLELRRVTLENGLRVVLNPDHATPTIAVAVTYDVGSRDDAEGKTGFAHLFEHMMFEGSKNVPKLEHMRLVTSHGGSLNATTSVDRTNYYELLPANELALALWLEADRMKALDVTDENFENQRKVVEEEYRRRYSNAPYSLSILRLDELVYQGYWPYEHSTIGLMKDLDDAALSSVAEFHAHHYGPNTAVLSIAGDFDPDEALAMVKKYFGEVPKIEVAPFVDAKLPEQTSLRTAVMHDDHARSPMILYGFPISPNRSPDHYALELAADVLTEGESSRLHQLLVRDKSVAQSVWAGTGDRRGPDLFTVGAKLSDGAKVGDVEKLIEAEIKAIGTTKGPTDAELAKAKRWLSTRYALGLQSNFARASRLGELELFFGDATIVNTEVDRYFAVTKDDIKRVAAQYLSPTKRTLVETYPNVTLKPVAPAPVTVKATSSPPAKPATKASSKSKKTAAKKVAQ